MRLGNVPFSSVFLEELGRVGINSSLNVWENSPVQPSVFSCVGRVLNTDSISLLVIDHFRFSISFFIKIFIYLFIIYLAVPGLSCSMRDLHCGMWDLVP